MRSFNFKFLIQADFLTASSREDVHTDRPWNKELRKAIVSLFCESIEGFKNNEILKYAWLAYLPAGIQNEFFMDIEMAIVDKLKKSEIIYASDNELYLPSDIRCVPEKFQDHDGIPLIPEKYISQFHYLSQRYDLELYGSQFRTLGVQDMTAVQFLDGLTAMGITLSSQTEIWLDRVCSILCDIFRHYNRGVHWEKLWQKIKKLPLVPLVGGNWVHSSTDKLFFKSGIADAPHDLSLRFIDEQSIGNNHRTLLKELGIEEANANEIATEIFELHKAIERKQKRRSTAELVKHAKFLFDHQHFIYKQDPKLVILHDRNGNPFRGSELYMDDPDKLPLSKVLSNPARFIHPDYLKAYPNNRNGGWLNWLRDYLKINTVPRLKNGKLSQEFEDFFNRNDSETWLKYLKSYWSDLVRNANGQTSFMEEISNKIVVIDAGSISQRRLKLNETYVRTTDLSSFTNLPFLPIPNDDLDEWSFLRQLGVSFDADAKFSTNQLLDLDKESDIDINTIRQIYKKIFAGLTKDNGKHMEWVRYLFFVLPLFDVSDAADRSAFTKNKLIYKYEKRTMREGELHNEWLCIDEVILGGPSFMTSKIDIRKYYPELEYFFADCLKIQPFSEDMIINELLRLVKDAEDEDLTDTKISQIRETLVYLAKQLGKQDIGVSSWLSRIIDEPVFLVKDSAESGSQMSLRRRADYFFIPDSRELKEVFSGIVPLLDYPVNWVSQIKPLLQHFGIISKNLSKAVSQEPRIPKDCTEDKFSTELLLERFKYIVRLIAKHEDKITKALHRGVQVYSAEELYKTFTLAFENRNIPPRVHQQNH